MGMSKAIDKMINTMSKEDIVKSCADSKMELMKIHASEMKEVLEAMDNIRLAHGRDHIATANTIARDILDKYRHYLGDGK